ncbi:heterotrimeric G-protein alpha subunit, GPA1-like protein [Lyophyllum atratum]|nr:heterotrimeric G-protein alpha subunit, GPA1-like protein [Lyophyllum atratum]
MGCVQSSSTAPITVNIHRDSAIPAPVKPSGLEKREIKLLLLGTRECGKSTILKQMRLIFQGDYNTSERLSQKEIIFANIVESMRAILEAMPCLDLTLSPDNYVWHTTIFVLRSWMGTDDLPCVIADAVRQLYRDPAVKAAIRRSREFQLNDNATYYFSAIDRIAAHNYLPTNQDILRSRVRTTGISKTTFRVQEQTYNVFDVAGPRSERRKWINCFENVDVVVFLVSLSEYDQMLWEEENVNRMQEALTLFESICNTKWFVKTPMILFLNKIDIFSEKLPRSPLSDIFPHFDGGADFDAACEYVLQRFIDLNQNPKSKQLYAFFTCATDTELVKDSLSALKSVLQDAYLSDCRTL